MTGAENDSLITISKFSRKYGVHIPAVSAAVFRFDLKDTGQKFHQAKLYDEKALVDCVVQFKLAESYVYLQKSMSLEEEAQQVEKIFLEKGK